jgi:hypothetical protein
MAVLSIVRARIVCVWNYQHGSKNAIIAECIMAFSLGCEDYQAMEQRTAKVSFDFDLPVSTCQNEDCAHQYILIAARIDQERYSLRADPVTLWPQIQGYYCPYCGKKQQR